MLTSNLDNIIGPPILTLIYLGLAYVWGRTVRRGKPLRSSQKGMILFSTLFVLGMVYLIAWKDELAGLLRWDFAWVGVMIAWGVLLGIAALWMFRRGHHDADTTDQQR